MKKYFYTNGDDKLGPFSIDELKEKNITNETFIWYEGLSDWKKASDDAKKWILWGAGTGLGAMILYFLFMIIIAASGAF